MPAMAAPLVSRQSSLASQLLQKGIAICPLPLWERACPRWQRCGLQAELAGKPAPTEKPRNLPAPPVGAGLPAMAALLVSRQSSLASQLLQRSIATRPSPCGSGLARDGSAAVFKAAPSDKHRYLRATFRSTCTRGCPLAGHSRPAAALGFNSKPVLFYILATNP